jgi:hypothetical protein
MTNVENTPFVILRRAQPVSKDALLTLTKVWVVRAHTP